MSTIKKKDFINNKTEKIEELVDGDGAVIGGDRNAVSNSEIETGPVAKPFNDDSDYEKGMPTTTDRAARYKQNIPWFAAYSSQGQGQRSRTFENSRVVTKGQVEEKIDDLVKKNVTNSEVLAKDYDNKVDKILNLLKSNYYTDEQLDIISKAITEKKADNTQVKNI